MRNTFMVSWPVLHRMSGITIVRPAMTQRPTVNLRTCSQSTNAFLISKRLVRCLVVEVDWIRAHPGKSSVAVLSFDGKIAVRAVERAATKGHIAQIDGRRGLRGSSHEPARAGSCVSCVFTISETHSNIFSEMGPCRREEVS